MKINRETDNLIKKNNAKNFSAFLTIILAVVCFACGYFFNFLIKGDDLRTVEWVMSTANQYGYFLDALDNFAFKGIQGPEKMSELMNSLRNDPPQNVGDAVVVDMEDYESERMMDAGFPKSNVLKFMLSDGSWVAVRPSGTEPKCKFYFSVVAMNKDAAAKKLEIMRKAFERV